MEETKTKYILVALVVIVIVVASVGFYLIRDGIDGITAKEGYIQAMEMVNERYGNLTVYMHNVIAYDDVNNKGECNKWDYYMTVEHINSTYEGFFIRIHAGGVHEFFGPGFLNYTGPDYIVNWTIDSHEAISNALSVESIRSFVKRYNDEKIDQFQLCKWPDYSDNPIWIITWASGGFIDEPHSINAMIDATTGVVLKVNY